MQPHTSFFYKPTSSMSSFNSSSNTASPLTAMEENKNNKALAIVNLMVHLLLFGTTVFIIFKSFEFSGLSKFSWHPSLMAISVSLNHNYSSICSNLFF